MSLKEDDQTVSPVTRTSNYTGMNHTCLVKRILYQKARTRGLTNHFSNICPPVNVNCDLWPWPSKMTYILPRWTILPSICVKGRFLPKLLPRYKDRQTHSQLRRSTPLPLARYLREIVSYSRSELFWRLPRCCRGYRVALMRKLNA